LCSSPHHINSSPLYSLQAATTGIPTKATDSLSPPYSNKGTKPLAGAVGDWKDTDKENPPAVTPSTETQKPSPVIPAIKPSRSKKTRVVSGKVVQSEAAIQEDICNYLTLRGIVHSITDSSAVIVNGRKRQSKVSQRGWPDITCALPDGRFLGIEVKSTGGKLRPSQVETLGRLKASGCVVIVAYSVGDVAAVVEPYLKALDAGGGLPKLGTSGGTLVLMKVDH
jgi:hypothetical protein